MTKMNAVTSSPKSPERVRPDQADSPNRPHVYTEQERRTALRRAYALILSWPTVNDSESVTEPPEAVTEAGAPDASEQERNENAE